MPNLWRYFVFFSLIGLWGCSTVRSVAVSTTADLASKASYEAETENSWEMFATATPGNLKFIEGLLFVEPDNEDLLLASLKARAGFAFGVYEVKWLEERLSGNEDESIKFEASKHYSKAVYYGDRLFREKGLEPNEFSAFLIDKKLQSELDRHLDESDFEHVFYYAQALGGLINLNRSSPLLIAKLPLVKGMFDWICNQNPDFQNGSCSLFYASYEAGRPKMLGGDLEKGKNLFLSAMESYPENQLIRVNYLIYYVIPTFNEKEYKAQKSILTDKFSELAKEMIYQPGKELKSSKLGLFNAIAEKQFEIIVNNEREIF